MSNELKRIEKAVDVLVGKPVTWCVYGLLLATRYSFRRAVRFGSWLRRRYRPAAGKA